MEYTVKIDRNSVKINPMSYYPIPNYVLGQIQTSPDGSMSREIFAVYSLQGDPKYIFSYIFPEITCQFCEHVFPHSELEDVDYMDEDGEEYFDDLGCPNCKSAGCCELEWEEINDVVKELGM
jgi:hypothetical protein